MEVQAYPPLTTGLTSPDSFYIENDVLQEELAVFKEWANIQGQLISRTSLISSLSYLDDQSLAKLISQVTQDKAKLYWHPCPQLHGMGNCQLVEVSHQHIRYGILQLVPGYLTSHLVPNIPQMFAHLCASIIALIEHRKLVQSLMKSLTPLEVLSPLTRREQDVLKEMATGKDEDEITRSLNIAVTTVRTHRHHIYQSLNVRTPQEAILRSFSHRMLNWIDIS